MLSPEQRRYSFHKRELLNAIVAEVDDANSVAISDILIDLEIGQ